jgi:THO complex subunit 3
MKDTTLIGHTGAVYDIAWHPTDSNILASVGADKHLRVWDIKSAHCMPLVNLSSSLMLFVSVGKQTIAVNIGESLNRLAWSPDSETMLLCGSRVLFTLDAKKFPEKSIRNTKLRQDFQQTLYSKDNSLVIVATSSDVKGTAPGVIQVFRPDNITPEGRYELSCHTGVTTCLASDKQGKLFASGGQDGIINIWDMDEIICTHSICNSDERVNSVSFSADGKLIASACDTQVFVVRIYSQVTFNISSHRECFLILRITLEVESKSSAQSCLRSLLPFTQTS